MAKRFVLRIIIKDENFLSLIDKNLSWKMWSHAFESIYSIHKIIIIRRDEVYNIFTCICIFIFIAIFYLFRYTIR